MTDKFHKEEIVGYQQVHALQILNDARRQFQDYLLIEVYKTASRCSKQTVYF
jgi:hypothetical protein